MFVAMKRARSSSNVSLHHDTVTQEDSYPGTPPFTPHDSSEDCKSDHDISGECIVNLMSGTQSLTVKFDAMTSVGYVRHQCMQTWTFLEKEKLKLLCGDIVLHDDCSKLLKVFDGKLTKSHNVLTLDTRCNCD